jgi:hypothetical protein
MINKINNLKQAIVALPVVNTISIASPHLILDYNDQRCANQAALKLGFNTVITTALDSDNKSVSKRKRAFKMFKLPGKRKITPCLGIKHLRVNKPSNIVEIKVKVKKTRQLHCGDPTYIQL